MKIFSIFLSFLFFISSSAFCQLSRSTSFDDRPACEESRGVWREFGNGCVDDCRPKFDKLTMCTNAATHGCDCGKGRCWAGDSCVAVLDFEKTFLIEQESEKKILEEAKEKRKADAMQHQQEVLSKLMSNSAARQQNQAYDGTAKAPAPKTNFGEIYKTIAPEPTPAPAPQPTQDQKIIVQPVPGQIIAAPQNPMDQQAPGPTPFFLKQIEQAEKNQNSANQNAATKKPEEKKKTDEIEIPGIPGLPVIPLPN